MANKTKIQWTEETWNPIAGCSVVSPGCTNCYAMRRTAPRLSKNPATPHYHGTVKPSKGGYVWTGKIGIAGDTAFLKPLRTRKPTMFFVNSMSDLFHENVPDEVIDRVFAVMALTPQHTYQVLTKRSARMREYLRAEWFGFRMRNAMQLLRPSPFIETALPLSNVWLGVSVEDQARANERIPDLLATPSAIRFISAEPLLGPVDLENFCDGFKFIDALRGNWWHENPEGNNPVSRGHEKLDWVIVGGESGKGARPMDPDWARSIRNQCAAAGVPFFFKQWGAYLPAGQMMADGRQWAPLSGNSLHAAVSLAGRFLDGVEHNAMPERA